MKILIPFSVLLCLSLNVFSQNSVEDFIKKAEAEQKSLRPDYLKTITLYESALKLSPENGEVNYQLGKLYLLTSQKEKSITVLLNALKTGKELNVDVYYYLGRAYHLNYEFDKAIGSYNEYIAKASKLDLMLLKSVSPEKRIAECESGKILVKDSAHVRIENVGEAINSKYSDVAPIISADGSVLYFTSNRPLKGDEEQAYALAQNIYGSSFVDGKWETAKLLGKKINLKESNATVGLSVDGQKMIVYVDQNKGDLFYSVLTGEKWSGLIALPEAINSRFHESTASYNYNGDKIYFVTNNYYNSFGKHDIFVSEKIRSVWQPAENVGKEINTQYHEECVFMHPDGKTMYFSSQGHNSMGGFDIFKSSKQPDGTWGKPENLGYPINTPDDDLAFVISADGKTAYYSTRRADSYGMDDVYKITFEEPAEDSTKEEFFLPSLTLVKGTVMDSTLKKNQFLETTIEVFDNETNELVSVVTSNSSTGKFLVSLPSGRDYAFVAKKEGYLFHSENFNIVEGAKYAVIEKNIYMTRIATDQKIVLRNVFFEPGSAKLNPKSYAELDRVIEVLNNNPKLKIEIAGHTDNKGTHEYNLELSGKRAQAVVTYLSQKISGDRMISKGYSFDIPVDTNETEEGRAKNRRVEFKILSLK